MTTEVRKRPINRLQSMYALRALSHQTYQAGREAKEAGRPVVWCMADALRKAEAFEETMDYYKKVRKEEGLEW